MYNWYLFDQILSVLLTLTCWGYILLLECFLFFGKEIFGENEMKKLKKNLSFPKDTRSHFCLVGLGKKKVRLYIDDELYGVLDNNCTLELWIPPRSEGEKK